MNELKALVSRGMVRSQVPLRKLGRMLREVQFPATPKLLGTSTKVEKGEKQGVLTAVLYLAPSTRSVPYGGVNMCRHATKGCIRACLGHSSGRLAMSTSQNAQVWKTLAYLYAKDWFLRKLSHEITAHYHAAIRKGLLPRIRLDGTSDTRLGEIMSARFQNVDFYDYTKNPNKALRALNGEFGPNYRVTFSLAESNLASAQKVAAHGGNVAVVFRTRKVSEFPAKYLDLPVINGDVTDDRFNDPQGVVVGLTMKGNKAQKDTTGFVKEIS